MSCTCSRSTSPSNREPSEDCPNHGSVLIDHLAEYDSLRIEWSEAIEALARVAALCSDAEDRRDWIAVAKVRAAMEAVT